jgi:hypothetical protein
LLASKWKSGGNAGAATSSQAQGPRPGEVRSFRITAIDPEKKRIEVEWV